MIFSLVIEDDVNLLGPWSADIRSEHEKVRGLAVHFLGVEVAVKEFDVSSAAVNVLLVLHRKLNHQRFLLVRKLGKLGRQRVEMGVLACLKACGIFQKEF